MEGSSSTELLEDMSAPEFPEKQQPDFFTHQARFTNPQAHQSGREYKLVKLAQGGWWDGKLVPCLKVAIGSSY